MTSNQLIKYLQYILLFVVFTACESENKSFVQTQIVLTKIDSLNSKSSVESFIRNLKYPFYKFKHKEDSITVHYVLENFELKKISEFHRDDRFDIDSFSKIIADSLGIKKSYYKADIDNNGFTDLIIIGDDKSCSGTTSCDFSLYTLMNFGNDSINPVNLSISPTRNSIVPKITSSNTGLVLEIFEPTRYHWIEKRKLSNIKKNRLTYLFDTFIELNPSETKYNIEKIEYSAGPCFGSCPIFDLSIDNKRNGKLNASKFNSTSPELFEYDISNEIKGQYSTIINKSNYDELVGILNYLNFPKLEDDYFVSATDFPSCTLKITYNNGKIKEIKDYGMSGSYGLKRVYELLFALRFNQDWK